MRLHSQPVRSQSVTDVDEINLELSHIELKPNDRSASAFPEVTWLFPIVNGAAVNIFVSRAPSTRQIILLGYILRRGMTG